MEKKFLEFVASIMEMDLEDVTMELSYKNSDKWNSLMMITLIMEIEAEYDVIIPMESLESVKTLADMYAFVKW